MSLNSNVFRPGYAEGQTPAQEIALNSSNEVINLPEAAVKQRANQILSATAAKHNLQVSDLSPELAQRAVEEATRQLEREAADANNVWKQLFDQQQKELELARLQLNAMKDSRNPVSPRDARPVTTTETAKRRVGPAEWSRMSVPQRCASIGVDYSTIDVGLLEDLFSRNASHSLAADLMKQNPLRYRTLKETATCLGIFGAPRGTFRKS